MFFADSSLHLAWINYIILLGQGIFVFLFLLFIISSYFSFFGLGGRAVALSQLNLALIFIIYRI